METVMKKFQRPAIGTLGATVLSAALICALGTGALTLSAGTAHADADRYLRNLEALGVRGASSMDETFLDLGKLACAANAAGYSKSQQERIVADRARDYLAPGEGMTYSKIGNKVRLSAQLFLCT